MTRLRKNSGTQQLIVNRKKAPDGSTVRVLECGHEQPESRGGRVRFAQFANCKACQAEFDAILLRQRAQ